MEPKKLVKLASSQGFNVTLARSGHYKVYSPTGAYVTTISKTPSRGARGMDNAIADLRRGGVDIPRK